MFDDKLFKTIVINLTHQYDNMILVAQVVQPHFTYISPFPLLKIFLTFPSLLPYARAHGARGFSIVSFIFPLFLNIYPSSARVVGFHNFIPSRLQHMK